MSSNNEEITSVIEDLETPQAAVSLTAEEDTRLRELISSGVFYGYTKSRTQPKMRPYIVSTRAGIEIIDLLKTMSALDTALKVMKETIASGNSILLVGTTPSVKKIVKTTAEKLLWLSVTERWLGGLLTNFKTMTSRISHFKKLNEDKASGELNKYTKKERILIDKELEKLERFLGGVRNMDKLPGLVVIVDLKAHELAAREARIMKIPTVAFLNTNADPDLVDYPIPASTRSAKSTEFLMNYIENEILKIQANV